MKQILILSLVLLFMGCSTPQPPETSETGTADSLNIHYAEGFSAFRKNNTWHLTIHSPWPDADRSFRYLLVPEGQDVPPHDASEQVIHTPVRRLIATSTTHVPLLDYLNSTQVLVGFPHPDYISSSAMRARIDSGKVLNVGTDQAMNAEAILSLQPGLIMAYSMSSDLGELERLRRTGIPYLLNADYLEPHPLGRAEWIRVAGLLLNREEEADSVFTQIERSYNEFKNRADTVSHKPSAFSGVVYSDTWFMPGGRNYAAQLMADAGIHYLWSDDKGTGFLELSFESVLEKAGEADLWIGTAAFSTLDELAASEPRYREFRAFREKKIYTYTKRIGPTGGNEYLELGYLRPDLILGDLVHIAHPGLVPDHSMYFYGHLE